MKLWFLCLFEQHLEYFFTNTLYTKCKWAYKSMRNGEINCVYLDIHVNANKLTRKYLKCTKLMQHVYRNFANLPKDLPYIKNSYFIIWNGLHVLIFCHFISMFRSWAEVFPSGTIRINIKFCFHHKQKQARQSNL